MSEKFDGVRAYWNGQLFISRYGKEISCPSWFIEEIPKDISLDGELCLGEGSNFELVKAILNSNNENDGISWKNINYMVFDSPNSNQPYESRMCDISNHLKFFNDNNNIHIVNIERCRGNDHLQEYLMNILSNGGEGLMVNKPNSLYVAIRTDSILKIKVKILILKFHISLTLL